MPITDDEGLDRLLDADTVAVIGCFDDARKAAHDVPAYLQRHGYRVIPVNPSPTRCSASRRTTNSPTWRPTWTS